MNIMYARQIKMSAKGSKICVLALDARTAFDQVEWKYILMVIKEFGLGNNFASWIEMLYARPTASLVTNHDK